MQKLMSAQILLAELRDAYQTLPLHAQYAIRASIRGARRRSDSNDVCPVRQSDFTDRTPEATNGNG